MKGAPERLLEATGVTDRTLEERIAEYAALGYRLLGVAAGPHSQLSQNIVSSWLCGARFIELKTVQILDEIEVSRPCIDAEDETYNCEWSQELKLEERTALWTAKPENRHLPSLREWT